MIHANLDDRLPNDATTPVVLRPDTYFHTWERPVSGRFEGPDDADWYRLDLAEGRSYGGSGYFTTSSSANTRLALVDARGTIITDSTGCLTSLDFSIAKTGIYYLVTSTNGGSAPSGGTYYLRAHSGDGAGGGIGTASSISPGRAIEAFINTEADSDWYRLDAQAGQTYHLQVDEGMATRDSVAAGLFLMDAAGNLILHVPRQLDGSAAKLSYTALTDGPLYVVVDTVDALLPPGATRLPPVAGAHRVSVLTDAVELTGTDLDDVLEGWDNGNVMLEMAAMTPCSEVPVLTRSSAEQGSLSRITLPSPAGSDWISGVISNFAAR